MFLKMVSALLAVVALRMSAALDTQSAVVLLQARANVQAATSLGLSAPLNELGYKQVAALKNNEQMVKFISRMLDSNGKKVVSKDDLMGFTPWFSGVAATQSFMALKSELFAKSWVHTENKQWMSGRELEDKFGKAAATKLVANGFVENRTNPDDTSKTQYAKKWLGLDKLIAQYGDAAVETMKKHGVIEVRANPDKHGGKQYFAKQGELGNRKWMSEKKLEETYGKETAHELIAQGSVAARKNPDIPARTQYSKNWKPEKELAKHFNKSTVQTMIKHGVIEVRQNPDAKNQTQFFRKAKVLGNIDWMSETRLFETYGNETAKKMLENNFLISRRNPDIPKRMQFAKKWQNMTALKLKYDELAVQEMIDHGVIEVRENPDIAGQGQFFVKAGELGNRAWMSERDVHEAYGNKTAEDMVEEGLFDVRQNPDIRNRTQYAKKWSNMSRLQETYSNQTLKNLLKSGLAESRKNPDDPKKVQYTLKTLARPSISWLGAQARLHINAVARVLEQKVSKPVFVFRDLVSLSEIDRTLLFEKMINESVVLQRPDGSAKICPVKEAAAMVAFKTALDNKEDSDLKQLLRSKNAKCISCDRGALVERIIETWSWEDHLEKEAAKTKNKKLVKTEDNKIEGKTHEKNKKKNSHFNVKEQKEAVCSSHCYAAKHAEIAWEGKKCDWKHCSACKECAGKTVSTKEEAEPRKFSGKAVDEARVCSNHCYAAKHVEIAWEGKKCNWKHCSACKECAGKNVSTTEEAEHHGNAMDEARDMIHTITEKVEHGFASVFSKMSGLLPHSDAVEPSPAKLMASEVKSAKLVTKGAQVAEEEMEVAKKAIIDAEAKRVKQALRKAKKMEKAATKEIAVKVKRTIEAAASGRIEAQAKTANATQNSQVKATANATKAEELAAETPAKGTPVDVNDTLTLIKIQAPVDRVKSNAEHVDLGQTLNLISKHPVTHDLQKPPETHDLQKPSTNNPLPQIRSLIHKPAQVMTKVSSQIMELRAKLYESENKSGELLRSKATEYDQRLDAQHQNTTAMRQANKRLQDDIDNLVKKNKQLRERALDLQKLGAASRDELEKLRGNIIMAQRLVNGSLNANIPDSDKQKVIRDLEEKNAAEKMALAHNRSLAAVSAARSTVVLLQSSNFSLPTVESKIAVETVRSLAERFEKLNKDQNASLAVMEKDFLESLGEETHWQKLLLEQQAKLIDEKAFQQDRYDQLQKAVDHLRESKDYFEQRVKELKVYSAKVSRR